MTHTLNIKTAGIALENAEKALIMIHGRGGSAEDILSLSQHLKVSDYALLAPQASNHTWYPHSFIAPVTHNEPWLSSAIDIVGQTVQTALGAGIKPENLYFFGFSQVGCLTLEFITRHAQRFGGALAIIVGVIAETINRNNYKGNIVKTIDIRRRNNPYINVLIERVYCADNNLK